MGGDVEWVFSCVGCVVWKVVVIWQVGVRLLGHFKRVCGLLHIIWTLNRFRRVYGRVSARRMSAEALRDKRGSCRTRRPRLNRWVDL